VVNLLAQWQLASLAFTNWTIKCWSWLETREQYTTGSINIEQRTNQSIFVEYINLGFQFKPSVPFVHTRQNLRCVDKYLQLLAYLATTRRRNNNKTCAACMNSHFTDHSLEHNPRQHRYPSAISSISTQNVFICVYLIDVFLSIFSLSCLACTCGQRNCHFFCSGQTQLPVI